MSATLTPEQIAEGIALRAVGRKISFVAAHLNTKADIIKKHCKFDTKAYRKERDAKIVEDYQGGMSQKQLADKYSMSASTIGTITKWVREPRQYTEWTDELWDKVVALREAGNSYGRICISLGLARKTLEKKISIARQRGQYFPDVKCAPGRKKTDTKIAPPPIPLRISLISDDVKWNIRRRRENGESLTRIAHSFHVARKDVCFIVGEFPHDLPLTPREASVVHLIDLKRAGHSPTKTELVIEAENSSPPRVSFSGFQGSAIGSAAAMCMG